MDFYIQPEDEIVLTFFLDDEDAADLKAYLRDQLMFENVRERGMAFDHALDPQAVVETLRQSKLALKVAHVAMQLGKDAAHAAVAALITAWVQKRNDKKKDKIEANETELILFDQHGHRLDLRPESKKKKKS